MFKFTVTAKDKTTRARVGELRTPRGSIKTPNFNPVGTQASVKTLSTQDLSDIGAQIVLANTYHLQLRPGEEIVKKMGGLGKFMGWSGPTMTDSGGFQVFSLGAAQHPSTSSGQRKLSKFSKNIAVEDRETSFVKKVMKEAPSIKPAKIDEAGVTFFSHLDGSKRRFTPESSIRIQEDLGADLIVAFDDHESPLWSYEETKKSLERTNRWGLESLKAQKRNDQLIYGVVHGGNFEDLRIESAKFTDTHFEAISIGGSYSSKEKLYQVLDWTVPYFSEDKPRHLLGIGEVQDLFEGIERGMDFFDCVSPTRRGRHGSLYIHPENGGSKEQSFTLQIASQKYQLDENPVDPGCMCFVCQTYTRAYINHLFRADELLGQRLGAYHNVYFIIRLVEQIREAIGEGRFTQLKQQWLG